MHRAGTASSFSSFVLDLGKTGEKIEDDCPAGVVLLWRMSIGWMTFFQIFLLKDSRRAERSGYGAESRAKR